MIRLTSDGLLSKTALTAITERFNELTLNVVSDAEVLYTIDPVASSMTVIGKEYDSAGNVGRFVGSFSVPYQKVDVEQCIPQPIFVDAAYPSIFGQFRGYLLRTYGIVFEEGELAKVSAPTVGLMDGDYADDVPEASEGVVEFIVTSNSGRFVEGGIVRFIIGVVNGVRKMNDVYRQTRMLRIGDLLNSNNPAGGKSLFSAPIDVCGKELIKRQIGIDVDPNQMEIISVSLNGRLGKFIIRGKSTSLLSWSGSSEFLYEKAALDEILPDVLTLNIDYPLTFPVLQQSIRTTYGFELSSGVYRMGSPTGPILGPSSVVNVPLGQNGTLSLYPDLLSKRWRYGSPLNLRFLQTPTNNQIWPGITNAAPDGVEDVIYQHQTTTIGGFGTMTFEVIKGQPPVPLNSSTGAYSGTPAAGVYVWTVIVRDSQGHFGLRTEKVTIAPPAP